MADDTMITDDGGTPTPSPAPAPAPTPAPSPAPSPTPSPTPAPADGGEGGEGGDGGAAFDFAKDWRAAVAGGDETLLGFLGRYQSPKAFVEAAKKDRAAAAAKTIAKLPDNPTDAEIAAYRKEHGIPDKPEGYLEKLPDGLVVGDDDKPVVSAFAAAMHELNVPPEVVSKGVEWYYNHVEELNAAELEAANAAKNESIELLRDEWQGDYRRNLNVMTSFLDTLPAGVADAFRHGKGADGIPLGYNAEVIKWLTGLALETNPLATVVPGAGADQGSAIADEMAQIEEVMRTDRNRYNKDEKMQARYRQLIEAQQKIKPA